MCDNIKPIMSHDVGKGWKWASMGTYACYISLAIEIIISGILQSAPVCQNLQDCRIAKLNEHGMEIYSCRCSDVWVELL